MISSTTLPPWVVFAYGFRGMVDPFENDETPPSGAGWVVHRGMKTALIAVAISLGALAIALSQPAGAAPKKVPNLSGYTLIVAGSSCPKGSVLVGKAGGYGAEDGAAATYGEFLYEVTEHPFTDKPTLSRDRSPLPMSACRVR